MTGWREWNQERGRFVRKDGSGKILSAFVDRGDDHRVEQAARVLSRFIHDSRKRAWDDGLLSDEQKTEAEEAARAVIAAVSPNDRELQEAYREGWFNGLGVNIDDCEDTNAAFAEDWAASDARAAITREGEAA